MYDRFVLFAVTEIVYQLFFARSRSPPPAAGPKNAPFLEQANGNVLWLFVWVYIGADFLYRANGYHYDWRNRIRLWQKFDLTGLYKALYQIYALFLGSVSLKRLAYLKSADKSRPGRLLSAELQKQTGYFFFALSALFCCKHVCAALSYSQEINMFRAKMIENVVISQAFMLFLIP